MLQNLAICGGEKTIKNEYKEIFHWPIITQEDDEAVLKVLHEGVMSLTAITKVFEKEFAQWMNVKYALAHCNGTASLKAALFGCGLQSGDEVIASSLAYWASASGVIALGGKVVFADIDPLTLCIDPNDIEHRITNRTKAIIVVHTNGHPCDMDQIMQIAQKHSLFVVEDVSHAQGGLYKGQVLGTIGDAAGISLMAGKSFPIGEGGMLTTNRDDVYERAVSFGHYERTMPSRYSDEPCIIKNPELKKYAGVPMSGEKFRMNQTCSAMGRVQLKHYPERSQSIRNAMNLFWDLLGDVPGLKAHRVDEKKDNSNMGGWYMPKGLYNASELGGLSIEKFCDALRAEGFPAAPDTTLQLHEHPYFGLNDKTPLKWTQLHHSRVMYMPWFKHPEQAIIEQYVAAVHKVIFHHRKLL